MRWIDHLCLQSMRLSLVSMARLGPMLNARQRKQMLRGPCQAGHGLLGSRLSAIPSPIRPTHRRAPKTTLHNPPLQSSVSLQTRIPKRKKSQMQNPRKHRQPQATPSSSEPANQCLSSHPSRHMGPSLVPRSAEVHDLHSQSINSRRRGNHLRNPVHREGALAPLRPRINSSRRMRTMRVSSSHGRVLRKALSRRRRCISVPRWTRRESLSWIMMLSMGMWIRRWLLRG